MKLKQSVKKFVFERKPLYDMAKALQSLRARLKRSNGCKMENRGFARIKREIQGENNLIRVGENARLYDVTVRIHGSDNAVIFDSDVAVGPDCSFWIEGNHSVIHIGAGTTFTMGCHFCVQEDNMQLSVGRDCMFSNSIIARTSDSHPIYDAGGRRINPPRPVRIGDHVWVAPNVKIMKGVTIGSNTIIGSDTIVTKDVPGDVLAVGHPAKVVKEGIRWTREALF